MARGDRRPFRALGGPDHPPAVWREPVHRRTRAPPTGRRSRIDAEVVPVDQEDEVVEPQSPGRVLGLVGGAGGEPALALHGEDLHLVDTGELEGQRLSRGGGMPWPEGPVLNFRKRVLPAISAWPGKPAAVAKVQQVLPGERPAAPVGEGEARVAGPSCRARSASLSTARVA